MELQSYSAKEADFNKDVTYKSLLGAAIHDEEYGDDLDDDEEDEHNIDHGSDHGVKKEIVESFEFTTIQSPTWKKHNVRRFFQDKDKFWTMTQKTNAWKWTLIVLCGVIIGCTGTFVAFLSNVLVNWKLNTVYDLMEVGNFAGAFFSYQIISIVFAIVAGLWCIWQPPAAGSGIPEIIAFLNGINLNNVVSIQVLVAKVFGMCFSVAAGLPLGKEGPMIHAGAIIGALLSQGYSCSLGYDRSWKRFQDLRNDINKRDFVTYGAAAGISAAFRAPIGGILFALEEGASFWSVNVTLRAFLTAAITQFTLSIILADQATSSAEMFAFGEFINLSTGRTNYHIYEVPLFFVIGLGGGLIGVFFNHINKLVTLYRKAHLNAHTWKRMVELVLITFLMSFVGFVFSIGFQDCTPRPVPTGDTPQEIELIDNLVQFQCPDGEYNQLASLYITSGDMATRQLFHFREFQGTGEGSFTFATLMLFFVPYFLIASITSGVFAPAGLFVPTLLVGAAYGRIVGHFMNVAFPAGYVADSGTYALVGAAAVLGGMARMTIAGTVICLEACGNMAYLLPLMVTFVGARYMGNAIDVSMYEMQIIIKELPLLEPGLHSCGMLPFQSVASVMTSPVVTLLEVDCVTHVIEVLNSNEHNAFPVINEAGQLRGIILRRTLSCLLSFKAYSVPTGEVNSAGRVEVVPASTVAFDTLERTYPVFPDIKNVKVTAKEAGYWLDMRPYMDPAPTMIKRETSLQRCYDLFRTMGLRHLPVVDGELKVVGIITRTNLTERSLHHIWETQGDDMIKSINVDVNEPTFVSVQAKSGGSSSPGPGQRSGAKLLVDGPDNAVTNALHHQESGQSSVHLDDISRLSNV